MEKWSNKIAVISGASSGIGMAIAAELLKYNITVVNLDLNLTENFAGNEKFVQHKTDLSSLEALQESFSWIEGKFGSIHILVNCAGILPSAKLLDFEQNKIRAIDKTIDVNFRAFVHCTREGIRLMKKSNDYGIVINICSIFGNIMPFYGDSLGAYTPAKHGVRAVSEIVRQELILQNDDKIRISNVSPGVVRTNLHNTMDKEAFEATFSDEKKVLRPNNIAETVLFLLMTPYDVNITELTVKPVGERI